MTEHQHVWRILFTRTERLTGLETPPTTPRRYPFRCGCGAVEHMTAGRATDAGAAFMLDVVSDEVRGG